MKRAFNRSLKKLLGVEGDFSNHPADPGGKTRFGITEEVAREHGYEGDMKELPVEKAKEIYLKSYWDINQLDEIAKRGEIIAYELFEFGVHAHPKSAAKLLQSSLNVLNINEELYDDIEVDGIIGEKTLSAFNAYRDERKDPGVSVLTSVLNARQGAYYYRLAEENPEVFENFVYGWFRKRVKL